MYELVSKRTGLTFPMFRASGFWVPGAAHNELATISATNRRVHVSRIWVSVAQSANAAIQFRCYRKATANTGGTSSLLTICKHETLSKDPTAAVRAYTGAPTPGTEGATIRTTPILVSGGGIQIGPVEWAFVPETPDGIVLCPGEQMGIQATNMDAAGTFYFTTEWYENPDL